MANHKPASFLVTHYSSPIIAAAYAAIALIYSWPLALHLGDRVAGSCCDAYQNLWNIWWVRTALFSGRWPFFSDLILYPDGTSLYLHTLTPYNGLVSAPLQLLLPLPLVYNLLALQALILAAFGMYLLARAVVGGYLAPFFAGLVYAFCPYEFAHLSIGFLNLVSIQWLPFYFWALGHATGLFPVTERQSTPVDPDRPPTANEHSTFNIQHSTFSPRWVLLATLFFILTALCDWQYAFYLALFSVPFVIWQAARQRRWLPLASGGLIAALAALALSPLLLGLFGESASGEFTTPAAGNMLNLYADLAAFFLPSPQHPLWGADANWWGAHFNSTFGESPTYLGYVPLLLMVIALLRRLRQAWFWAITMLIALLLSLGPRLHIAGMDVAPLPYLLDSIPALKWYRAPVRFFTPAMLFLALLAALGLSALLTHRPRKVRLIITAIAASLLLVEYLPIPFPLATPDLSPFYQQLAADPDSYAIIELPINLGQPRYVYAQTIHHKPLVGGYLARPRYYPLIEQTPPFRDLYYLDQIPPDIIDYDLPTAGRAALRYYHIGYLIVHSPKFSGPRAAALKAILAAISQPTAVYSDSELIAWRPTDGPDAPFLTLGDGWGSVFGGPQDGDGKSPPQRSFNRASLDLYANVPTSATLTLDLQAPAITTTLNFNIEGTPVYIGSVGKEPTPISIPLKLKAGEQTITISGAGQPLVASHVRIANSGIQNPPMQTNR